MGPTSTGSLISRDSWHKEIIIILGNECHNQVSTSSIDNPQGADYRNMEEDFFKHQEGDGVCQGYSRQKEQHGEMWRHKLYREFWGQ